MIRVPAVFFLCLLVAQPALGGVGNPEISLEMAYQGPEAVCLLVVPDGSGRPFTEARTASGQIVDATLTAEILDINLDPIASYPAEDVWLTTDDEGLVRCPAGMIADGPTDAFGRTTFSAPPRAGGWDLSVTRAVVSGWTSLGTGVALNYNSPDLNGDLEVNLSDVQLFAADFFDAAYHHRADLYFDGTINLADIVPLARAFGAACP